MVMGALKRGSGFSYTSDELEVDKGVVLEAVKRGSGTMQYTTEELKVDKEVVLETCQARQ